MCVEMCGCVVVVCMYMPANARSSFISPFTLHDGETEMHPRSFAQERSDNSRSRREDGRDGRGIRYVVLMFARAHGLLFCSLLLAEVRMRSGEEVEDEERAQEEGTLIVCGSFVRESSCLSCLRIYRRHPPRYVLQERLRAAGRGGHTQSDAGVFNESLRRRYVVAQRI